MSSVSAAWFPSSFQLRLAFNDRRSPTLVFLRTRFHSLDRLMRLPSVSRSSGIGSEGLGVRRPDDSWVVNSNTSADGFAGWTDDEQATESRQKQPLKEIIGAGLAGFLLVTGLVYAALSLGKRRPSRLQIQMEPLIYQEEISSTSMDQEKFSKEDENDRKNDTREDDSQQSMTGSSSNTDGNETSLSNNPNCTDTEGITSDVEASTLSPIQKCSPSELTFDNVSFSSGSLSKLPTSKGASNSLADSISEDTKSYVLSPKPEASSEVEAENLIEDSFPSDSNLKSLLNHDTQEEVCIVKENENPNPVLDISQNEPTSVNISVISQLESVLDPKGDELFSSLPNINQTESSGATLVSDVAHIFANEQSGNTYPTRSEMSPFYSSSPGNIFASAGIPAPSAVSTALLSVPGKVLVPAVIDQVQGQALAALQALKVIEVDAQPGDICTRREYARWLVSSSSVLSRSSVSKVYPAMYIENVTELAFDDITAEDPDFSSIQGLAEAGLISSKLSRHDMQAFVADDPDSLYFSPASPLSRQDLVSWKMALEKKSLPVVDRKNLQEISGFIDIDKINPNAWPALVADLAAGEQGIVALAFGYTRLFQPDKPTTKAQAAIALAAGESSDIVDEELARIEAESMAEKVVAAQSSLVAQVEEEVNATYEKELHLEREKVNAVEKLAAAAREELDKLRSQREEENLALLKERAVVDSEMEVLSRLRRELEEQLRTLLSNKVEVSYEKERLHKLRKDAEFESQEIARLQYELEVERKALSMARSWAEEEAKRARDQAKALEEAREKWVRQGIKVVVDDDLRQEENAGVTWLGAGHEFSVESTVGRAENLVDRLKEMAKVVSGKSSDTINKVIQRLLQLIDNLKEWVIKASRQTKELKDAAISNISGSLQNVQQQTSDYSTALKGGLKRVAEDCREGVERITQKFKT